MDAEEDGSNGGVDRASLNATAEEKWRGCTMEEIYHSLNPFELDHVGPVRPGTEHTVLHQYPIRVPDHQPPPPFKGHPKWDSHHVRLPCSPKSQYPVTQVDSGREEVEPRWEKIQQSLLQPIRNSHELEHAILAYNAKYASSWDFVSLHKLFDDELDSSEAQVFFDDLLPRIIHLALRLPELIQAPIPLLKQGRTHSITLTQEQISCLLANAFLCTFPRRNTLRRRSEYSTFPDINFNRLYQSTGDAVLEKIKCICHYFRRVCPTDRDNENVPRGVVTFMRRSRHYTEVPIWGECDEPLGITPLHMTAEGTIEDQGFGLLQVDFANKFLGGGVLGTGCVQEEIRFVICPELFASKLFTECLRPTEALFIYGCERYSNYTGYASSFQWAGDHEDALPRDSSRRRMTHIVAIDALNFNDPDHQYREELMLRELNKAYVGFLHTLDTPAPGVATGNWGCGAFGGDAYLKALLQLMACTVTKRPLVYYTFGNMELCEDVHRMHTFFIEHNVRVRDLWVVLKKFRSAELPPDELYAFICKQLKRSPNLEKKAVVSRTHKNEQPGCSKSFAPVKVQQTKKVTSANLSQDLFASESEPELVVSPTANADSMASGNKNQIYISDDSETDILLAQAMDDVPRQEPSDYRNNNNKQLEQGVNPQSPATRRAEPRQRTLLEMLDKCYTETTGPANKRHCLAAKSTAKETNHSIP